MGYNQILYLKKVSSIVLLGLLACNILGSTFVFFMDEWQKNRIAQPSVFFEENGEHLVIKLPMAIPYQTNWNESQETEGIIIYKGDFFRTYENKYQNDTLYTYCTKESASRENVFSLLQKVKSHLSDEPTSPSKKAMDFLKNLSKDYTQIHSKTTSLFWIEDLPVHNYSYNEFIPISFKLVHSPPPDLV